MGRSCPGSYLVSGQIHARVIHTEDNYANAFQQGSRIISQSCPVFWHMDKIAKLTERLFGRSVWACALEAY